MITVRVTFWAVILLIILSSLLDVSGDFDLKLTRIEDGNSTIENAVLELNSEVQKSLKVGGGPRNKELPYLEKEKNEKKLQVAEIHSSFGETLPPHTDFKSEITQRKGTNAAPSVSQADVSNRISETGQAVVVSLVDTASMELQQRASLARDDAADNRSLVNASDGAPTAPRPALRDKGKGTGTALPVPVPLPAPPPPPTALPVEATATPAHVAQPGGAAAAPAPDASSPGPAPGQDGAATASEHTPIPPVNGSLEGPRDAVDAGSDADANATLQRDHQYVVRAEPKVVEVKEAETATEAVAAAAREGAETATKAEATEAPTAAASTPAANASAVADAAAAAAAASAKEAEDAAAAAEDIPSFSEWAQRQLAEAEEKKKVLNASAGGPGGGARPAAVGAGGGGAGGGGAAAGGAERLGASSGGGGGGESKAAGGGGSAGAGSGGGSALKLRSKNYASPDCGAKIIAANPEGVSPYAVLTASRDEYMLNTCTTRIWFVVELCEAIQAKKIELANFELFSSSPRDFAVSVSDRVQGREWRPAGHFTATEERSVQSFALSPQQFGRYVKVEILSHHGSEHYCPLSLFRVYGTSEFEVLEKVDQASHDDDGSASGGDQLGLVGDEDDDDEDDAEVAGDDDERPAGARPGDPPRNLFESYKNAVLSIVKKAAQALTKGGDESNDTSLTELSGALNDSAAAEAGGEEPAQARAPPPPTSSAAAPAALCKSPRHLVVCDNCSDALYGEVFALLSCRERHLDALLAAPFVAEGVREGGRCARFGLQLASRRVGAPFPLPDPAAYAPARAAPVDYLAAVLPPSYLAALCNLLAIADRRVALNVSAMQNASADAGPTGERELNLEVPPTSPLEKGLESAIPAVTCTRDAPHTRGSSLASSRDVPCDSYSSTPPPSQQLIPQTHDLASQIKPTKTLAKEEGGEDTTLPLGSGLEGSVAPSVLATDTRTSVGEETAGVVPATPTVSAASSAPTLSTSAVSISNTTHATVSLTTDADGDREIASESPGVGLPEPADADTTEGDPSASSSEEVQENLDSLIHDLNNLDQTTESPSSPGYTSSSTVANTPAPTTPSPSTASQSTQPAVKPPQTQTQSVQKESVFVRLANRIKVLERNMSLSGQYLEELSRRYKKQMEEMQKAFNRTLQAVQDAGRINEEREARRQEEMQQLQQQLAEMSRSLENLLGERESWLSRLYVLAQHIILICVEIIIFGLLVYFCRRLPDNGRPNNEHLSQRLTVGVKSRKSSRSSMNRRKSVDGVSGHESPRTRNRRPSEEALHISGSYQDLLITDPGITEIDGNVNYSKSDIRRRRRKKKDLLMRSASTRLPVRSEPLKDLAEEQRANPNKRSTSLELDSWWSSSNGVENIVDASDKGEGDSQHMIGYHSRCASDGLDSEKSQPSAIECVSPHGSVSKPVFHPPNGDNQNQGKYNESKSSEVHLKLRSVSDTVQPKNNGLVRSNTLASPVQQQVSPPVFMRTATSVRNSRLGSSSSVDPSPPAKLKSDNWEWYSSHHGLDKSSQCNKVTCPASCPGSYSADPSQKQNGHSTSDGRRNSNASSSTSSASNVSEGTSRKDTSKKGPSGLKKMVKKFF